MEFNEKLQELRKQKGLTQEALAQELFVSRTAISKWESGRGYPNIDSLKAIAKYFSVTIDELLSSGEVLSIAEEEHKQKQRRLTDLVFGLMDCSVILFFFLPLFGRKTGEMAYAISLLKLQGIASYLRSAYFITVIGMTMMGVLTLAPQNCRGTFWGRNRHRISLALNAAGVLVFIISSQPYAAAVLFVFMIIKCFMLAKQR